MFEKLFCKHDWCLTKNCNILEYPGWMTHKHDNLCNIAYYNYTFMCEKCCKRKKYCSKPTKIYWRAKFAELSSEELIEFEVKKRRLDKKVVKFLKKLKLTN